MLSLIGPVGIDPSKAKAFGLLVLRKMALAAAATVGTELGKLIVKRIIGGDDDDDDGDPEDPESGV